MTEPVVALSDYGLTLESAILAMLTHRRTERTRLREWVVLFFAASAMASLAGGTVHGFTGNPASRGHRVLWPASLISVGVAGLAGTMIGTIIKKSVIAAGAGLGIYSSLAVRGKQRYGIAAAALLPPTAFLGGVLWQRYRRLRQPSVLAGLAGLGVSLLGAGLQQTRISIRHRFIDHNVIYHLLQGASLILLYRCFNGLLADSHPDEEGVL